MERSVPWRICAKISANGDLRSDKYGNRHFWARGYFVDTVGKNKKKIQEYIKNQLQQDQIAEQLSLKEFVDPFTGSKEIKA